MKKVLFTILLFLPIVIHADYAIDNYRVDVTINKNGDANVVEMFSMNGVYNGFEKTVYYKGNYDGYRESKIVSVDNTKLYNANDVILKEIRTIDFNINESTDKLKNSYLFSKVNKATKGEYGVYTVNKKNNNVTYKIYNPSKINKDFYINYVLDDIAILHDDVAEVGLKLFSNTEKINHLEINIYVPDDSKYLHAYVHTPDDYTIAIENGIKIIIDDVTYNNFDIRVLYDKDVLVTNKKSNQDVLTKISEIEEKLKNDEPTEYESIKEKAYLAVTKVEKTKNKIDYEEAYKLVHNLRSDELKTQLLVRLMNIESKVERKFILLKISVTSCMSFIIVGILLIIYRMYRKESTCIIDRIPTKPYMIGYLCRKKISKNDFVSSIVKLIDDHKIDIIKTKRDYKLIKNDAEISNNEDKIFKYIFGNEKEITISKLKKKYDTPSSITLYSTWHNVAIDEAIKQHYYEDLLFYKIFGVSYAILGIIASALLLGKPTYFSPIITIIISIMSIVFFIAFYKRTTIGSELFYQVMNVKHFVSNIDKVKINKKAINEYLRYAIVFSEYNKVSKFLLTVKNDENFINKLHVIDSLLLIAKK